MNWRTTITGIAAALASISTILAITPNETGWQVLPENWRKWFLLGGLVCGLIAKILNSISAADAKVVKDISINGFVDIRLALGATLLLWMVAVSLCFSATHAKPAALSDHVSPYAYALAYPHASDVSAPADVSELAAHDEAALVRDHLLLPPVATLRADTSPAAPHASGMYQTGLAAWTIAGGLVACLLMCAIPRRRRGRVDHLVMAAPLLAVVLLLPGCTLNVGYTPPATSGGQGTYTGGVSVDPADIGAIVGALKAARPGPAPFDPRAVGTKVGARQ